MSLTSIVSSKAFKVYLRDPSTLEEIPLNKSNRWYISTTSTNTMMKHGGKNNSTVHIPDGANAVVVNNVTTVTIPADLNYHYYINNTKKLIKKCRGAI